MVVAAYPWVTNSRLAASVIERRVRAAAAVRPELL
jgi:hypothetical protein